MSFKNFYFTPLALKCFQQGWHFGPFKMSLGAQTSNEAGVISSHLEGIDIPLAPKTSIIYEKNIFKKDLS